MRRACLLRSKTCSCKAGSDYVGQVDNLQPIGNRLGVLPENLSANSNILFMETFGHRRLPHHYVVGHPLFITWRLYRSLPRYRSFPSAIAAGAAFLAMDRILDNASIGPRFFCIPEIADMVTNAIHYHDQNPRHFDLHAFVVMPNHVHLLMTPKVAVSKAMQSIKRFTARDSNRIPGRTGQPFWQDESYDRLVRDEREFERIMHYIEMNPVRAGLASTPEEYPWSSGRPIDNRPQVGNLPHVPGEVK
jgi:REP element-mobilizing transposase RayT